MAFLSFLKSFMFMLSDAPIFLLFFFSCASPKCPQFLGGMVLTFLTSQQTLPEVCSEQDEMDFLMEALIIRYSLRFLDWWWTGGRGVMQLMRIISPVA